jgi:DNA-binding NarL/FixJ family response regulator
MIAEDHVLVRQGFKLMLERDGFEVVGEAGDGREAIRLSQEGHPDVALLDMALPLLNGIDAAREIARVSPRTRCILVTMYDEQQYVVAALRAGVRGYVLKTRAVEDLERAIREVHDGGAYLSTGIAREFIDAFLADREVPADPLTPREREVLQLVAEGRTTKEVASLLNIAVKTAECHRTRIMGKLDIHETAGLVRFAIRQGLIQP